MTTTTRACLTLLPTELLLLILERVGPLELHRLAAVSRFFQFLLHPTSSSLWFTLLRAHSPYATQILCTLSSSTTSALTPRDLYFAATLHTQVLLWPTDPELTKEPHVVHDLPTSPRCPFGRAGRVRLPGSASPPTRLIAGAFGTHVLQADSSLTTLGQVSLFAPWCATSTRKHLLGHFAGVHVADAWTSRTQLVVRTRQGELWDVTQVPTVACGVPQCMLRIALPDTSARMDLVGSGSAHVIGYAARTRRLVALRSPLATALGQVPARVGTHVSSVGSTATHVVVATRTAVWTARMCGQGPIATVRTSTWEQVWHAPDAADALVSMSAAATGVLVQCSSGAWQWVPVPHSPRHAAAAAFSDTGWPWRDTVVCGSNGQVGVIDGTRVRVIQPARGTVDEVPLFADGTWLPLRVSVGGAGLAVIAVPLSASFRRLSC